MNTLDDDHSRRLITEAIVLVAVTATTIFAIKLVDPRNETVRYYASRNNDICAFMLQICASLVIICFALNVRYLLSTLITRS